LPEELKAIQGALVETRASKRGKAAHNDADEDE